MLVLSRKTNECVMIGDIPVVVLGIHGKQVRLGVEAPKHVPVHRREIYDAIVRQQEVSQCADRRVGPSRNGGTPTQSKKPRNGRRTSSAHSVQRAKRKHSRKRKRRPRKED